MNLTLQSTSAPAVDLMNTVLRGGAEIAPEYPLVFDERFPGRVVAIESEQGVHSACGILTREFVIGDTRIRGGLIGSVATGETWRGRGFGTRLLVEAEAALHIEGCGFAMLWAQDPAFYLERGYGPIGRELDVLITPAVASKLPVSEDVRELRPEDSAAIHALYSQHTQRAERTSEETSALLACPDMTVLVIERADSVVAYTCLGRGADLESTVHEWGGADDDVLPLLRAQTERLNAELSSEGPEAELFLMAPTSRRALVERLSVLGASTREGMLGLARILDRGVVAETISALLGEDGVVEVVDGSQLPFFVRGPLQEGFLDDEGALALLFGVADVTADVTGFLEGFGLGGARLPLEPFLWGLDSI